MRRLLVTIVALLVIGMPTAEASTIGGNVLRIGATRVFLGPTGTLTATGNVIMDWGPTIAYENSSVVFPNHPAAPISFAFPLRDLLPGTAYHLRFRVDGAAAVTGTDQVFVTAPRGGALLSAPADELDATTTTPLTGTPAEFGTFTNCTDPQPQSFPGSHAVTRYRAYSFTNPTGSAGCATVKVDTDTGCNNVQVLAIAGVPGGSYANAVGGDGSLRVDMEFQFPITANGTYSVLVADDGNCNAPYAISIYSTTLVPPTATTAAATAAGPRSITLRGTASANQIGGTSTQFEWGRTPLLGNVLPVGAAPADAAGHAVAARLGDLTPGVRYYARLVATGPGGRTAGGITTFLLPKAQTALRLSKSRLGVPANGRVDVPIVCPLTTTICKGKVVLRRNNKARTSLGSKTFTIAGGKTGTVRIKLSTANRRLVKRVATLKITATLTGVDGDVVSFPTAKRGARLVWRG